LSFRGYLLDRVELLLECFYKSVVVFGISYGKAQIIPACLASQIFDKYVVLDKQSFDELVRSYAACQLDHHIISL